MIQVDFYSFYFFFIFQFICFIDYEEFVPYLNETHFTAFSENFFVDNYIRVFILLIKKISIFKNLTFFRCYIFRYFIYFVIFFPVIN